MRGGLPALLAGVLALQSPALRAQDGLTPTAHPPLPTRLSQYWLVPDFPASRPPTDRLTGADRLARGAGLIAAGDFAGGLRLVHGLDLGRSPVAPYAGYYTAVALIGLGRHVEAETALAALLTREPAGSLQQAAMLQMAAARMAAGNPDGAADVLAALSARPGVALDDVLTRLGRAAEDAGRVDQALQAYRRVHYEFPLGPFAAVAEEALARLEAPDARPADWVSQELARAERLFAAGQWARARAGFAPLVPLVGGGQAELVAVHMAAADYYLNRHRAARDALQPYLTRGSRQAEARFFHLSATRRLGDHRTFMALARSLAADEPASPWAAEALNSLASHLLAAGDEAAADAVFRELNRRFPSHRHSERAAWRIGWRAYLAGRYAETVAVFEDAAARFRRADYRPSWLYWAARSRERLGDHGMAAARYRLVVADYRNSYYGRLALARLGTRIGEPLARPVPAPADQTAPVPTAPVITELVRLGLLDDALQQVQYAQQVWGDSPRLQATVAWIRHTQGRRLAAADRFTALRGAITTMRRAYPQFMAAGGEDLPPEVLRVIFPLDYWPLIRKYSEAHELDPYLMAALMAQESTFTPEIRSSANAYGLMQVIPATGRLVAAQLGIRGFTTSMLTVPETNVRIGMKYFKDLLTRFGATPYALAGYNAGPQRVARWREQSPGLAHDEFVDNIPFAETQAYVKRILGTAEDYRRLYGEGLLDPDEPLTLAASGTRQ